MPPSIERLLGKVKTGMPVTHCCLAERGRRVAGTIGEIVPAVDPATRTFPVKVYLKEPSLRSGLYVKIRDTRREEAGLARPGEGIGGKGTAHRRLRGR